MIEEAITKSKTVRALAALFLLLTFAYVGVYFMPQSETRELLLYTITLNRWVFLYITLFLFTVMGVIAFAKLKKYVYASLVIFLSLAIFIGVLDAPKVLTDYVSDLKAYQNEELLEEEYVYEESKTRTIYRSKDSYTLITYFFDGKIVKSEDMPKLKADFIEGKRYQLRMLPNSGVILSVNKM